MKSRIVVEMVKGSEKYSLVREAPKMVDENREIDRVLRCFDLAFN